MVKTIVLLISILVFQSLYSMEPRLVWQKGGQEYKVNDMVFSNDGKTLFVQLYKRTGTDERRILQVWDVTGKNLVKEIPCSLDFAVMAVSPDGKKVIGSASEGIGIEEVDIDADTTGFMSVANDNPAYSAIDDLAYSPDGKAVYAFEWTHKYIQRINAETHEASTPIYVDSNMTDVYLSRDGALACSKNKDSSVSVWDLTSFTCLQKVRFDCQPFSVSLSPDKKYIVVNFDFTNTKENVRVVSVETGIVVAKATSKTKRPYSFFASDNETVITPANPPEKLKFKTGTASTMNFGQKALIIAASPADMTAAIVSNYNDLFLFNMNSDESQLLIKHEEVENLDYCSDLTVSPDNKYLFLCGGKPGDGDSSGTVVAYDLATGQYLGKAVISNSNLSTIFLSKDGSTLAVSDAFGNVFLLFSDVASNKTVLKSYSLNKNTKSVLITPDNKKVVLGGNKTGVNVINIETGSVNVSDSVNINILSSAINSTGSKIAIGTSEKYVGILEYDSQDDKYKDVIYFKSDSSKSQYTGGISHVSFSKDDKYIIACASDYRTYIYNADTYAMVTSFKGKGKVANKISSADIAGLNNFIFVADFIPALRIFDVSSQEEVWKNDTIGKTFMSKSTDWSIKLSDDNKYLACAFKDGSVGVFDVTDYTSVEDGNVTDKLLPVYPNPAGSVLFINYAALTWNDSIRIYSPEGVLMLQSPQSDRIDISSLAPGIYFVRLGDSTYKFVKL